MKKKKKDSHISSTGSSAQVFFPQMGAPMASVAVIAIINAIAGRAATIEPVEEGLLPAVAVESGPPPELVPTEVAEPGVKLVLPPLSEPSVVTALFVPQAPCRVDRTFMLARAAGVDPQLAAGAIHTALFSRSKVAATS